MYRNNLLQLLMYASDLMGKNLYFFIMQKRLEWVLETGYLTLRINNWEKLNSLSSIAHGLSKKWGRPNYIYYI